MYSICLIIPYFGKFPNYFNLFLQSCAANPTINWMIFTDNEENYDYPDNVKRIEMSFSQMKVLVQSKFDFCIALDNPYKICDFRPAYGVIFSEFLTGYGFWGYCDIDLLFGDISKFISPEMLHQYDKIGIMGHLSIYKNTDEINHLFKSQVGGQQRYYDVFTSRRNMIFDEWDYPSINDIFLQENKRVAVLDSIADIYPNDSYFHTVRFDIQKRRQIFDKRNCLVRWENGHVFLIWRSNGQWNKEERLYVHLQKRKMRCDELRSAECFYIVPDRFMNDNIPLDTLYAICKSKRRLNLARRQYTYKKIRYWLIEKTGPVRHWFRARWRKQHE